MKKLSILGSTGSIGTNALRVVEEFSEDLQVAALAAGRNLSLLAEQARRYRPRLLCVELASDRDRLKLLLEEHGDGLPEIPIVWGVDGLRQAATFAECDSVLCAIAGATALFPVMDALYAGKQLSLATKEVLVMAGELVMRCAEEHHLEILPVDSEHNAIHQCLRGERHSSLRRLVLTASGGPFLHWSEDRLATVTPDAALQHPIWKMGRKITIDSATMMNKGLEVIEAHWLFRMPADRIEVLIHPQSTVHSMVEMIDGSVLAQLGVADMRNAIQYALFYPDRRGHHRPALDWKTIRRLDFLEPDRKKFPCLDLAYAALQEGGTMPAVMNAANEAAVSAFLDRKIRFTDIAAVIGKTMEEHVSYAPDSMEAVLQADRWARLSAAKWIDGVAG